MNNVPGFAFGGAYPPGGGGPAPALGFGPGGGARRSPEQQRPLWTSDGGTVPPEEIDSTGNVPPVLYVSRARPSYNGEYRRQPLLLNGNIYWKQPESEHRILHTSDRGWVMAEGHKPMYHLHRPATSEPTGPGDLHKFDWTSQQKGAQFDNPSVTLRRPEDDDDLSSAMRALWHDPDLCDVRFELDDGSMVNASRTILAARSPYFKTMFFGSMREAREATAGEPIKLREIRRETLDGVLEFCYTGSISSFIDSLTRSDEAVAYAKYAQKVDDPAEEWFDHESKMVESLTELLKAANLFQLERLLKMCEAELERCVSETSVANILAVADLHNANQLRHAGIAFVKKYSGNIPPGRLETLPKGLLVEIIRSPPRGEHSHRSFV